MNYNEKLKGSKESDQMVAGNGYKIIEVNISDSAEGSYAVCTPIKKQ